MRIPDYGCQAAAAKMNSKNFQCQLFFNSWTIGSSIPAFMKSWNVEVKKHSTYQEMLEWVKTSNLKIMLDGLFVDPSTKFFTAEGYIFTVVASDARVHLFHLPKTYSRGII
ncbi:9876_t:CDS:2 [Funneliformis caledonium]|uniref:9876_t:CDS:1 n=1 Tax=Funneliformis caledonium TaxID=1117310 RepID=A0A9N9FW78_9GLOM|nr:9876_t:CDS:2 [Funneliformis caledonium]